MSTPSPTEGTTGPPPDPSHAKAKGSHAKTPRRRVNLAARYRGNVNTDLGGTGSHGRVWEVVAALAAVVAAVVAVLALRGSPEDDPRSGDENPVCTMEGDGNSIGSCAVEFRRELGPDPSEAAARAEAHRYADVDPTGDGPWPFFVLDTGDGLKVRTSGEADGVQIGSADDGTIVHVECREHTGFEPNTLESRNRAGDRWLRTLWPNDAPTNQFFVSSPGDRFTGYVYEGFVIPAGHNGDIPDC